MRAMSMAAERARNRRSAPKKRSRRDDILEAATVLFNDRGYHATTVRDIAERAGMLSGSLYTHIKSKEDLLYEISAREVDTANERLETIVAGDLQPTEKLREALRFHFQLTVEFTSGVRVYLYEWQALGSERRELIRAKRDRQDELWEQLVEEGIEKGAFADLDAKFARLLLLSVGNWAYVWFDPSGALSAVEAADRMYGLLLGGFAAPHAPASGDG
jgi:AcrR family transcriptional regulator